VWPLGTLDTAQGGLSHATPQGRCYAVVRDPSPAHIGVRGTLDRGFHHTSYPQMEGNSKRPLFRHTCSDRSCNRSNWASLSLDSHSAPSVYRKEPAISSRTS